MLSGHVLISTVYLEASMFITFKHKLSFTLKYVSISMELLRLKHCNNCKYDHRKLAGRRVLFDHMEFAQALYLPLFSGIIPVGFWGQCGF